MMLLFIVLSWRLLPVLCADHIKSQLVRSVVLYFMWMFNNGKKNVYMGYPATQVHQLCMHIQNRRR